MGIVPVSYTHLDVYKRQIIQLVLMIKGDYKTLKRVLTLTLALAIVAGGYMFEANGAGEQPSKQAPSISDVYKRQV